MQLRRRDGLGPTLMPHIERLLPSSASAREFAIADALSVDLECEAAVSIKDPATCPVSLLPYLAAEESVDRWSATWPEEVKRAAIVGSWAAHRRKGTPAAMDDAVTGLGPGWLWSEWFEYGGQPYRFRLTYAVGVSGLSFSTLVSARDRVNAVKNVRSIMELRAETAAEVTAFVGVFSIVATHIGDLESLPPIVEMAIGVFGINETSLGDLA